MSIMHLNYLIIKRIKLHHQQYYRAILNQTIIKIIQKEYHKPHNYCKADPDITVEYGPILIATCVTPAPEPNECEESSIIEKRKM
mmetsp:Transcript_10105/g.14785  ORF Transcript_10105/g.14785 Transcript_10105/m.14785 type:complete len:85 (-) Transcript_10105:134-388(-)